MLMLGQNYKIKDSFLKSSHSKLNLLLLFFYKKMIFLKSKSEKQLDKLQKCTGIVVMLQNDFPLYWVYFYAFIGLLFGIICFVLQIISIVVEGPLYFVGTG